MSPLFPIIDADQYELVIRQKRYCMETQSYFESGVIHKSSSFDIAQFYGGHTPLGYGSVQQSIDRYTRAKLVKESIIFTTDDGQSRSIDEAEDLLISSCNRYNFDISSLDVFVDENNNFGEYSCYDPCPSIIINRQCNIIAAKTCLGCGNNVLMNAKTYELIKNQKYGALQEKDEPVIHGRWKNVAIINNSINVWLSNCISDIDIFVFLNNDKFHPAIMLGDKFIVNPGVKEYIRKIKLNYIVDQRFVKIGNWYC